VYVPGNHEFYGSSLDAGWKNIRKAAARFPGAVHVLDNSVVEIKGARLYGGTGWFPLDSSARTTAAKAFMSDFHLIRDLEPRIYESHSEFARGMPEAVDVVVSHHLPTPLCVHRKYRGSPLNAFFVSNFDVERTAAKLWLHGHTHEQTDVTVGRTRIVANPLGYPSELPQQAAFKEELLLEI
jgi:Icc-related predicted phosphoesterase